jgi:predicted dehydrogenase
VTSEPASGAEGAGGRYRVALLGLGSIARAHLRGYQAAGNATRGEIVAGADVSEEARARFAAEVATARTYADFQELLERERPDVVSVCTWPPLHPQMVQAAAEAGVRGILCEKPMALDLAGCDRMLAAAEKQGAVLVVGHQRRLQPKFSRARALIEEGAIGELELLCGIAAGDLLTDGTHTVDALRFFTGDTAVEWVMGNVDLRERELPPSDGPRRSGFQQWDETRTRYGHRVEAGACATLAFAGGVRATLELGICARPGYQRFAIYGSEGMIKISGDRPAEGEPLLQVRRKGGTGWEIVPGVEETNGFAREISLLFDSLQYGTPHPLSGRSARATQEILIAVFESARRPGRVELPFEGPASPLEALLARQPAPEARTPPAVTGAGQG